MTNHVHLLLTPSDAGGFARLTRNLGQRYAQYFNRRYGRSGTLWEGRPYSCLVDSGRYVLGCYRYIERNPVRAGMACSPAEYKWSSHESNAGRVEDTLLTPHPEYLALGDAHPVRRMAYLQLFAEREDPAFVSAMRDATNGGFALVGDDLKARLVASTDRPLGRRKRGPKGSEENERPDQQSAELPF